MKNWTIGKMQERSGCECDSVVRIQTDQAANWSGGTGCQHRHEQENILCSNHPALLINLYLRSSPGRGAGHPAPSSAQVMNKWSYICASLHAFITRTGANLPSPLPLYSTEMNNFII